MRRGRFYTPRNQAIKVHLTAMQKEQLESFANSTTLPFGQVQRAKIILLAAAGTDNIHIATKVGMSRASVGKWRRRFVEGGIEALYDQLGQRS